MDNDENNTKGKNSIIIQENLKFNPLIIEEYFRGKNWSLQEDDNLIELREYLKFLPNTDVAMDNSITNYINVYYLPYKFER